jgi:hypothetical protein
MQPFCPNQCHLLGIVACMALFEWLPILQV